MQNSPLLSTNCSSIEAVHFLADQPLVLEDPCETALGMESVWLVRLFPILCWIQDGPHTPLQIRRGPQTWWDAERSLRDDADDRHGTWSHRLQNIFAYAHDADYDLSRLRSAWEPVIQFASAFCARQSNREHALDEAAAKLREGIKTGSVSMWGNIPTGDGSAFSALPPEITYQEWVWRTPPVWAFYKKGPQFENSIRLKDGRTVTDLTLVSAEIRRLKDRSGKSRAAATAASLTRAKDALRSRLQKALTAGTEPTIRRDDWINGEGRELARTKAAARQAWQSVTSAPPFSAFARPGRPRKSAK